MVFNWCNRWFICHIIRNWFISCCYWHCHMIFCAISDVTVTGTFTVPGTSPFGKLSDYLQLLLCFPSICCIDCSFDIICCCFFAIWFFNWLNRWFICHIIRNWFISCCYWHCHMIFCAIRICHCYWYVHCAWYITFGKLSDYLQLLLYLPEHLLYRLPFDIICCCFFAIWFSIGLTVGSFVTLSATGLSPVVTGTVT